MADDVYDGAAISAQTGLSNPSVTYAGSPSTGSLSQVPSNPVEMVNISPQTTIPEAQEPSSSKPDTSPNLEGSRGWQRPTTEAQAQRGNHVETKASKFPPDDVQFPPALTSSSVTREQIIAPIGPSTDNPVPATIVTAAGGPQLIITLLLHTGARHPYKIDAKYLKRRGVSVIDHDPVNMSVYTLKELIWKDWRDGNAFCSKSCLLTADSFDQNGNLDHPALPQ